MRAKLDVPVAGGTVAGIFLYAPPDNAGNSLHDEIDFEIMGNDPNHIYTNIYGDEPLGYGHPEAHSYVSGSATDYHIYEIRWMSNQVSWLVDGEVVRVVNTQLPIPQGPMYLHLNMWAPANDFAVAYNQNLRWVNSQGLNQTFSMSVDYINVSRDL